MGKPAADKWVPFSAEQDLVRAEGIHEPKVSGLYFQSRVTQPSAIPHPLVFSSSKRASPSPPGVTYLSGAPHMVGPN
jgi:hypothetical protein